MMHSIGYSAAAGTNAADRASSRNAARNSAQSKDASFDQVFSSTVSDSDTQPHRAQATSDETSSQKPIAKKSDAGQSAAQQPDAQPTELADTSATATPDDAGSARAASQDANISVPAGQRPAPVDSTAPVRRPRTAQPAAGALAGGSAGSAIDPSSLTMLLGAGTARAANPAQEPGATAQAPETATDDPETQPVMGLAAQVQKNAGSDDGLAFALRLSRTPAVAPPSDSPSSPFANALAAAGKAVTEVKTRLAGDFGSGVSAVGMNVLESAASPTAATGGNQPAEPAPLASSASSATAPELPSQPSEPVRAVRVQLAIEGNQRVDLTLVERAGALSVSVRSADSNLTRTLQEHLPDLSARLTGERYQTELWTPRAESPSLSSGQSDSSNRNFESGGNRQGGQNGNSNPQQQGKQRDDAPEWLPELMASGKTLSTRREYLWVQ